MEKTQLLEVGNLICESNYTNDRKSIIKVTRVTSRFAFVAVGDNGYEQKFQREVRRGSVIECNRQQFSRTSYAIATEQDHIDIKLRNTKVALEARFNLVKSILTMKDCEALMDILIAIQ